MKNYLKTSKWLRWTVALSGLFIIFFSSCYENEMIYDEEFETILFDGDGLISKVSDPSARTIPVFNKPIEIKQIKHNNALLRRELSVIRKDSDVNIDDLEINQARVFTYKDSRTQALAIPFLGKVNEKELVVYLNSEGASYCLAHFDRLNEQEKKFKVTSLDGNKVFYSMILNQNHRIRELKVRKIKKPEPSISLASLKTMATANSETCPESTDSFDDCMVCAIADECAGDWQCAAMCMLAPAPCLIGFGIACGFF